MKRPKYDRLVEWCLLKKVFSKSEVITWGIENYYISSDRMVRKFVENGSFRKIPKEECIMRGLKGKQAWYEVNDN